MILSGIPFPYFLTELQLAFIVFPGGITESLWSLPPAMAFLFLQAQFVVGFLELATEHGLPR